MQEEHLKFKKLLEYFVSHLDWVENRQITFIGYSKYIKQYAENGSFKMTGQGYDGAGIQNQIKGWEYYSCGKICINVQGHFGNNYKSVKCYLNWAGTGLNVLARWKNNQITSLYQDEFIYWEEPTRRVNSGKEYSLEKLKLFEADEISGELIDFFSTFKQRFETFQKNEKKEKLMSSIYKNRDLLKYKKQIILQGPPGTGKTKLAKEIAESIVFGDKKIDILTFKNIILTLKSFKSRINFNSISIDYVQDETIYFKASRSVPQFSFTFNELYDCYINQDYLGFDFVQYPQYAKRSLVWLVVDTYNKAIINDQFKLIQFHPSYTYEDLVRGIEAESKGEKIVYKNVNKTLGLFAKKALENYLDSQKPTIDYTREKWVDDQFTKFKDTIAESIDENGKYELTTNVSIVEIDDDSFGYIGNSWQAQNPHRMRFQDIKTGYLSDNLSRQELKNNPLVSRSAFQHATYYFNLLQDFRNGINDVMPNDFSAMKNNIQKPYVLIIDEINRANLSSVLGELIYALEYRGEAVDSMYNVDGNEIILPPNLYIIGTMNTADRSVGHIDYAIRRRFAFVNVLPENLKEKQGLDEFHEILFLAVEKLFNERTSPEFEVKDVQLGHSYFIDKSEEENGVTIDIRFEYEIKPILLEYVKDGVLIGNDIKKEIENLKTLL